MFRAIQPHEIFDPHYRQISENHPAYWLAQLRKADWLKLLAILGEKLPRSIRKEALAQAVLARFNFEVSESREKAWLLCQALTAGNIPSLVIQFRHRETDWTRGVPEFVNAAKGEQLGFANIAGRLVCKVNQNGKMIV